MSHVTGINLLTCVNWDAWQDLIDCIEVKKMDIYVLYVQGHKTTGHLICSLQLSGWLYFFSSGQGALLAFKKPLTCERF